jgi:hypothetical protein
VEEGCGGAGGEDCLVRMLGRWGRAGRVYVCVYVDNA